MTRALVTATLLCAIAGPAYAQNELGPPIRVLLFSDATYLLTEQDVNEGFSLGQVVGHLNGALTERFSVAVEATLTPRSSGTVATLERLIIGYHASDAFKLSAGRYHTPISWWNTQYHHGLWLQTSIDRPRMVRFGTPLIPVHFVGFLASGNLPLGGSILVYEAGAGNGRAPDLVGAGDAGEQDGKLAVVSGLRFRPGVVPALELGIHGYVDQVDPVGTTGPVDERILGGHASWMANPEVVVEYLHFIHEPVAGGGASTSDAFYAQVGVRLPPGRTVQPYVRFERIDIAAGDPLFAGLGLGYEGVIGGLRWDFAGFAALKGEVRSEEVAGAQRATSFAVNASFVIPNIIE